MHMCQSIYVEVKRQLSKVRSLPPCVSLELNSGHQAFTHVSHLINPVFVLLIKGLTVAQADPELTTQFRLPSTQCNPAPPSQCKHYRCEPPHPVAQSAFMVFHRQVRL